MIKKIVLYCVFISFSLSQENIKSEEKTVEKMKAPEKQKKKTMEEALKNTEEIPGLFTVYQDSTNGKLYMVIAKEQLGKEYIHFVHGLNGQLNA